MVSGKLVIWNSKGVMHAYMVAYWCNIIYFSPFPILGERQEEYVSAWENQLQVPIAPNSKLVLYSANKRLAPFTQFKPFILYHISDDTYERFIKVDTPNEPTCLPKYVEDFKHIVLTAAVKGTDVCMWALSSPVWREYKFYITNTRIMQPTLNRRKSFAW